MENILGIILLVFIIVLCCFVAVGNLVYRRRRRKRPNLSLKDLESLKEQGIITEEEFESLKNGARRPQELFVKSCTFSAEEMMEAIDAALKPVNELERDNSYTGDEKWAEVFGIRSALNLSLKELALLSMKVAKPREAIDLMAEVLAMNIPIDALEAVQKQGRTALPPYKAIARMIWVQARKRLSEPISIRKEIHKQQKSSDQSMSSNEVKELLSELVPIIMKALHIPTSASGFAVILALMVAKMEFNALSHENEDDSYFGSMAP